MIALSVTPDRATPSRFRAERTGADGGRFDVGGLAFPASFLAVLLCLVSLLAANESEWPIFVLGLAGLLAGKVAGVSERSLAVIALVLIVLAWPPAMFTSPLPRLTSTISHFVIGALLAWFLRAPVMARWPAASRVWFVIPVLVLSIGVVWELGEWLADAVFGSDLTVDALDTLADLGTDFIGAVAGFGLHRRLYGVADGDEG